MAAVILFGLMSAITFVVVNAALHFVTDYITSRISSKLWAKQDWHRFFATIGFDQLIHQATLAFTLWVDGDAMNGYAARNGTPPASDEAFPGTISGF